MPDRAPTALVVEDDAHIGHLLKFMPERAGYQVTLCADGRAVQACIQGQPAAAVAVFDVMLPFMDGLQLVALVGW